MSIMYSSPSESIEDMILLMDLFKKVLSDKVETFKETQDIPEFQQGIIYLRKDLQVFKEIFEVSYQDAETVEEYKKLETLAKELNDTQKLLYEANQLTKSS